MILAALVLPSAMDGVRAQANKPATTPVRAETQLSRVVVFISVELKASTQLEHPRRSNPGAEPHKPNAIRDRVSRFSTRQPLGQRQRGLAIHNDEPTCSPEAIGRKWKVRRTPGQQTYVTLNLKEPISGSRSDRQPLNISQQTHWYFPKDQAIDLAVIPFAAADKYDALPLSADILLTSFKFWRRMTSYPEIEF